MITSLHTVILQVSWLWAYLKLRYIYCALSTSTCPEVRLDKSHSKWGSSSQFYRVNEAKGTDICLTYSKTQNQLFIFARQWFPPFWNGRTCALLATPPTAVASVESPGCLLYSHRWYKWCLSSRSENHVLHRLLGLRRTWQNCYRWRWLELVLSPDRVCVEDSVQIILSVCSL